MQTIKISLQSSTSSLCILDIVKEFATQNRLNLNIKVTEDVEFEDSCFLGDLHEFELPVSCFDFILARISGKVLEEVLTSGGDDSFFDYTPDLMHQFHQLLTQVKAQAEVYDDQIIAKCTRVYNHLLQYQCPEHDDDCHDNYTFDYCGLKPLE